MVVVSERCCGTRVNCYGPTTYSARVPTCRLRTTADAVYVTACLHYRAQGEVGRVAEDGLRVGARDGGGDSGEVMPIDRVQVVLGMIMIVRRVVCKTNE